ncbi:hypothetical protein WJX73_008685 [Symbiochloris irregularis]|uniref:Uncharacterized protein n=1 Tax=Symbiochloris irregularis TaxID=706552 RepID=A0AAW1NNC9_9CHLO
MARLVLKPTRWGTATAYDVIQEGAVRYNVDTCCSRDHGIVLTDRLASDGVVLSAEHGSKLSNIEFTGPAGELVTTAKASSQLFADIDFHYGGRQYRWVPAMRQMSSKFKFTLVDASSGRKIASLKQISSWSRASELALYAGNYDAVWCCVVVLSATLAFKQWQDSMFLTLTHG